MLFAAEFDLGSPESVALVASFGVAREWRQCGRRDGEEAGLGAIAGGLFELFLKPAPALNVSMTCVNDSPLLKPVRVEFSNVRWR